MINSKEIHEFISLQVKLVDAFLQANLAARDYEWLLDFPKKGDINVDGEVWQFSKHGKGVKFFKTPPAHLSKIVDVHCHINNPKLVDYWRLSQYFSSYENEFNVTVLLNEMVLSGELIKKSDKLYELNN